MYLLPSAPPERVLPHVPALLAESGGEFCVSRQLDSAMVRACCRLGYLPMADEYQGRPLLLIKCHLARMVLHFPRLHISRGVRRRVMRDELRVSVDDRFEEVMKAIDDHHDRNWLSAPFRNVLHEMHYEEVNGVSVHSVEISTSGGELLAGEVGYRCGTVYTSLSGFHRRNGTGTIQLVMLARVLERWGFSFWDLGMDIPYKRDLGALDMPRVEFLRLYRSEAGLPAPGFPTESLDCRDLL